jgi:Cu/Ag efflux protein CusF
MKQFILLFCAAAILAMPVFAGAEEGQQAPAPQKKKGRVVAETMIAEHAVVKAVDMDKRTLTLTMADGKERTFVIDKRVKKLGQVKAGDVVTARYREAVSVKLNKTKVPEGVTVETAVKRDERSVKPSAVASQQVTTTATIEKMHDDGKWVTLRMPDGSTADVKVLDKENLAKIKKGEVKEGDQIEITFTQALAISVEKVAEGK